MICRIHLVCETVLSLFCSVTDLSTEQFFDEMSKEFFMWCEKSVEIQTNYKIVYSDRFAVIRGSSFVCRIFHNLFFFGGTRIVQRQH